MILAQLNGGIGNQLFQYAAAKSLALYHNTSLRLDITPSADKFMPDELRQRPFDLHYFNLPDAVATAAEIRSATLRSPLEKISEKTKPNYKRRIYREPFFHFDNNFFNAGPEVYLKGLWQSEKYFLRFEAQIRDILKFNSELTRSCAHIASKLKKENSVSIHVRRGDYMTKVSQDVLGSMPVKYYDDSIKTIRSKISDTSFYFFSDDIDWVQAHIQIPGATYVSNKMTNNHVEDLYLMSQCRHNIIANSSFSWWGGWLNNNPGKIVIAPKKWFNNGPKDTGDLIPDGWIKV